MPPPGVFANYVFSEVVVYEKTFAIGLTQRFQGSKIY